MEEMNAPTYFTFFWKEYLKDNNRVDKANARRQSEVNCWNVETEKIVNDGLTGEGSLFFHLSCGEDSFSVGFI